MQTPAKACQPVDLSKIQRFLTRTFKSKFVHNVAVATSGNAGAQVIAMAFSPIITRLYGAEALGILGTFMAIVAVVTSVAALSYPIAIVLPKEDSDARGIARLSIYIALFIAALVALLFLVAGDWLVQMLQVQETRAFIFLIPLIMIFSTWFRINQQWLIRKKQFKTIARVAVFQAFIVNSAKAGVGLFRPLAAVLIVLYTLGSALHAAMIAFGAKKAEDKGQQNREGYYKPSLWDMAKKHYDFPLYRAPNEFINAVSQGLPVLMLAAFFGPVSAGFYTLSIKLLGQPSQLLSNAVGDVFYPRINEAAHRGENLTKLIINATLSLAAFGIVPFAMVVVFGPWLFGFVFGQEWVVAGEYARWLAMLKFFQFINVPSVKAIPTLGLQFFLLLYGFAVSILRLIALTVGFFVFHNDLVAIAFFGFVGVLMYILLIVFVIFKSDHIMKQKKCESSTI